MNGPAINRNAQGTLGWRDRILARVKAAGKAGLTTGEVAEAIGHQRAIVSVLMGSYVSSGHLWNQREGGHMRYYHAATVPVGEGVAPMSLAERQAIKARLKAQRVNLYCEQPSTGPVMPKAALPRQAVTRVVDGVVVTDCPPMVDTRFTVDPDTFKGGSFMAEWRQRRAGGAR